MTAVIEGASGPRSTGPTAGAVVLTPGDADSGVDPLARPTGREEAWRFTPLRRLGGLLDAVAGDITALDADIDAPAAVTVTTDKSRAVVLAPRDVMGVNAVALAPGTVVLTVPRNTVLTEPVRLVLRGPRAVPGAAASSADSAAAPPSYVHIRVVVERGASAVVLLDHQGGATTAEHVELIVGDAASLSVVSVQEGDRGAVLAATHRARVGRDATYRHASLTLGGDLVRLVPTVEFAGPGADVDLSGVWLTDTGQHHELRLLVDHSAPHCKSRVTFKGALQGEDAHSVWIGDVVIRATAIGTDTYELNRNLVLTDGARADSVPNLEISTGEIVGAGHASATGRFDAEQLFYLMSRGIAEDEARRMVVRGFFAEVLGRVADVLPDIAERISASVEERV